MDTSNASDDELIVDAGPDFFGRWSVARNVSFNQTTIVSPDPIDLNRTYTFSWDFDDKVDADSDGIFDNDNENSSRYPVHFYRYAGKYVVTCTLSDGTSVSKDTCNVQIGQAWILSLTSEKSTYNTSESLEIEVEVERGQDPQAMTHSYNLVIEVFNENANRFFNDSQTIILISAGYVVNHKYTISGGILGDYNVKVTLLLINGAIYDVMEIPIKVIKRNNPIAPVAVIHDHDKSVFVGEEIQFNASGSYDPDGWIIYYHWKFGDGGEGFGNNISYTFHETGEYLIILKVSDNDEMTSEGSSTIKVRVSSPTSDEGSVPFMAILGVMIITSVAVLLSKKWDII